MKARLIWEFSSAGRASALQAEGQRFDPVNSHKGPVVLRLSRRPVTAKIAGSIPVGTVGIERRFQRRLVSSVGRAFDF